MAAQEIKLKIHEEADMFSPFDPEQKLLSEDVSDYLIRCYENKHRKTKEELVIHIYSDTPVNEERVKQAIRDYCAQEKSNNRHEGRVETLKEVALGILGLLFLSLWFILSATHENVWMEVLSIVGWVAVWEATSIAIMSRPELFIENRMLDRASKAQIIVEVVQSEETEA